uniref:deleted in malignant brain tumors 1 protein n=1 Tax=Myodes glareolus TaxID=447135 RepID=UPI0020228C35|nr:deleted in malignant brain tumors 1 protein [Myodes glareolus]
MGKVCAGAELTFLSSSNSMTVVFKSDAMITNTGFCALYNTVHQDERQNGIDDTSSRGPADPSGDVMTAQLSCLPLLFQAVIDRGYLRRLGYSSWDIHLNDRMCRPQVTGRYLIFNIPYGHCGTIRQEHQGSLSYSNSIRGRTQGHPGRVIVRHKVPQVKFTCKVDGQSAVGNCAWE